MPHRRSAVLAATSALALAGPLLLAVQPATAAPSDLGTAQPTTVEQAQQQFEQRTPERYRDQDLSWATCSAEQIGWLNSLVGGLECASVAVPRDWNAPEEGEPLQVTISRVPQTGPRPERTIITNPGGPGGAGLALASLGSSVPALAGTEVIGLDVRGTGASSNLTCGADALAALSALPDYRDRSLEALALTAKGNQAAAEACADDPLKDVVTTQQTVYDIDLVRDALDRDTVDWVGYSGGTWLGTQFATHLPGRVGRFVLDSTVDATAGYQEVFDYQPMAFQRRFEQDYAPWAAAGHSVYGLGATGEEVVATYERLRASVAARPLGIPGFQVDGVLLDALTLQSMYGKADFPTLSWFLSGVQFLDALRGPAGTGADLPAGVTADLAELARALSPEDPTATESMQATFAATTCNDSQWNTDQSYWNAKGDEAGAKYPLVGYSTSSQICAYWDRPDLDLPAVDGADLPPLLIVQSRHDPATAYEGAVKTHEALGSSILLTVEDEGDHGIYGMGNPCVDAVVGDFLTTGAVPDGDLSCQGVGLPPVAGAGGESLLAKVLKAARTGSGA
ncbi:alpha/beta hydrolase [Kineococcus sp. SYSU DK003]|uniref:alpha/beta hydrolase n=1 Tax=Kineococcus sp. SYSU DK003 TaxID=3383124 RepID=UPI003D7ED74C